MTTQAKPVYSFLGNCENAYTFQGKDNWNLARAFFHRGRVLILQGPMYMGKTRLAEEVAKCVDKLINENDKDCGMKMFSYMTRCGMIKRFSNGLVTAKDVQNNIVSNLTKSHKELLSETNNGLIDFFDSRLKEGKESFLFIIDELDCMQDTEVSQVLDYVCDYVLGCPNVYFLLTSSVIVECPRISDNVHVHWCKQMKHKDAANLLKDVAGDDVPGLRQCEDSLVERFLRIPFYLMIAGQKMKRSADIRYTPKELLELTDEDSLNLLLDLKNVPTKDAVGDRQAELFQNMPQSLTNMFSRMCESLDLKKTFRASDIRYLAPGMSDGAVKRGVLQELRDICLLSRDQDDTYDITLQSLQEFNNTQFVAINGSNDEFIQRIFHATIDSLKQVLQVRQIRTAFSLWKYEKSCLFAAQKNLQEQQLTRGPEMKHSLRMQLIHAACAFLHNSVLDCTLQQNFKSACLDILREIEEKEQGNNSDGMKVLVQQVGNMYIAQPTDASIPSQSYGPMLNGPFSRPTVGGNMIYHPSKERESLQRNGNFTPLIFESPSMDRSGKSIHGTVLSQVRAPYMSLISTEELHGQSLNDLGRSPIHPEDFKQNFFPNKISTSNSFQSHEMPAGYFNSASFNNGQIQSQQSPMSYVLPPHGQKYSEGYQMAQHDQQHAYEKFKNGNESQNNGKADDYPPKRPDSLTIKATRSSMMPLHNNSHPSQPQQNSVQHSVYHSLPNMNGLLPLPSTQFYYPNQAYITPQTMTVSPLIQRFPSSGIHLSHVPNSAMVGHVGPSMYPQSQVRLPGAGMYHQDGMLHHQMSSVLPFQTVNVVPQGYNPVQPYSLQSGLNNASLNTQSAMPANFHGHYRIAAPPLRQPRGPSSMTPPSRYQYHSQQPLSSKYRSPVILPPRGQGAYHTPPSQGPGLIRGWSPTPPTIEQSAIHQKPSLQTPPPVYYPPGQNIHMYHQNSNGYIG